MKAAAGKIREPLISARKYPSVESVPDHVPYQGTRTDGLTTFAIWINIDGVQRRLQKDGTSVPTSLYSADEMRNFAPFVAAEEG